MAAPFLRNGEDQQAATNEYFRLLSQIQPVKFGNTVLWTAATTYTLAQFQTPREAVYCVVMRVESYTVNLTSGATDYGVYQPPPPGKAYWQTTAAGSSTAYLASDDTMQSHVMLDVDEFRIFGPGEFITLTGEFLVSPDGLTRNVRATVYAYLVAAELIERIGQNVIFEPPSTGV